MVHTLTTVASLRDSKFGRPSPRHGLKLLYWFATNYIDIDGDNQMKAKYDPKGGEFGFHHFQNRKDNCDNTGCRRLLPESNYPYYEVGNLHYHLSNSLPGYVQEGYTGKLDDSNTDRIIINLRQGKYIEKVYVTQHEDITSFDPDHTYCISNMLLKDIRNLSKNDFLSKASTITRDQQAGYSTRDQQAGYSIRDQQAGYSTRDQQSGYSTRDQQSYYSPRNHEDACCCTIQ